MSKLIFIVGICTFFSLHHQKVFGQSCPECKEVYFANGEIKPGTACQPTFGLRSPGGKVCTDIERCLQFDNSFQFNPPESIYIFDWGDGTTDTLKHEQLLALEEKEDFIGKYREYCHKYTETSCGPVDSVYTVQVNLFNPNGEGCSNVGGGGEITVITPVIAEFLIPEFVCINSPFTIENISTQGFNEDCTTDATYEWDFNSDNTVDLKHDEKVNFTHQFNSPGEKTIELTAYHDPDVTCGRSVITHKIMVLNLPKPVFNIGDGDELQKVDDCGNNVFVFNPATNACIDVSLPLENITENRNATTKFRWSVSPIAGANFDNADLTLDNNIINFTEAGAYKVTLTVEDNCADGLTGSNTACITVIVKDKPNVSIETQEVCEEETFTANLQQDGEAIDPEAIKNIEWEVKETSGGAIPSFTDGSDVLTIENLPAGAYEITASYESVCGKFSTEKVTTNVKAAPPVNITTETTEVCTGVLFTLKADYETADTYTWFENGVEVAGENVPIFERQHTATGEYEYYVVISKDGCENTSNTLTITVNPAPTADPIAVSKELFCNGEEINFTLTAQNVNPPDATLQWQSFDAEWKDIEGAKDPTFTGSKAGSYRVVVSSSGCSYETEPVEIRQMEPIMPEIVVTKENSCNAYTLSVENTDDNYSYQWQLNDVDIEGAVASTYAVPAPGKYTVVVMQEGGCPEPSAPKEIEFDKSPEFVHSKNKDFYCSGETVEITLTSESPSLMYSWAVIPVQDVSVSPASGTGDIQVKIENNATANQEVVFRVVSRNTETGCESAALDIPVPVGPALPVTFDKTPDELVICGKGIFEKTIVAESVAENVTYSWKDADENVASTTATLTTAEIGVYTVEVKTSEGCIATETIEIIRQEVLSEPKIVAENPAGMACPGTPVLLEANADGSLPITSYQWLLDGEEISGADKATWPATQPGEYKVIVNRETLCKELSNEVAVAFFPEPEPKINDLPTGLCPGDDNNIALKGVNDNPAAANTTYAWAITPAGMGTFSNASAPNPTLVLKDNQSGDDVSINVSLTLTSDQGCEKSTSETLLLSSRPIAGFSAPSEVCEDTPLTPEDQSSFADKVSWFVDPAEGVQIDNPEARNPTIIFPKNKDRSSIKSYTLTQLASRGGCTDVIRKTIQVHPAPKVSFETQVTPENGCGPVMATFVNQSTGVGLTYQWDFGNGNTDNGADPVTAEFLPDIVQKNYIVSLAATNDICGTITAYDTIVVRPSPKVSKVLLPLDENNRICADFPVPINYLTLGQAEEIFIDFGDGKTTTRNDTTSTVEHTYRNETKKDTTFTLKVAATSACGTDTLTREVVVTPNTVEAFYEASTNKVCQLSPVRFTSNQLASASNGFIANNDIKWVWGDGEITLDSIAVSHTYKTPGTYYPMLIVSNGCNIDTCSLLTDSGCGVAVEVLEIPEAAFTINQKACVDQPVAFVNESSAPTQPQWSFGDGGTSDEINPEYTFTTAGTYTVILNVEDINKCQNTMEEEVVVSPLPKPDFFIPQPPLCAGDIHIIPNNSTGASSFLWEIRDREDNLFYTSFVENPPTISFSQAGRYDIQLTAYDEPNQKGCANTLTEPVNIGEVPEAEIIHTPPVAGCGITTISFSNDPGVSRTDQTFFWDFGNGNATNEFLENYTTYEYENYEDTDKEIRVTLRAEHTNGCTASDEKLFVIPAFEENIILPPEGEVICFTPGKVPNQEFRLRHQNLDAEGYQMRIYNQYGNEVFQTDDLNDGWDGIYKGEPAAPDVYVVVVQFKGCINGELQSETFPICVRY